MRIQDFNADGTPKTEPVLGPDGVATGERRYVFRNESREEIIARLRAKYAPQLQSGDPQVAQRAQEQLDWLDLELLPMASAGPDPRVDALEKAMTSLNDRVTTIEEKKPEPAPASAGV